MTFDHRAPGTPADAWAGLVSSLRDLPTPGPGDHLLVVAAHPDDETLGAGGLIASAARRGSRVTVIVATDGDASHPRSPTHRPGQLAAARRREVYAALAALAPDADVHLLGLPDGRLAECDVELSAALGKLVPGCSHLVTPWSEDRHPDHEACARAGRDLAGVHGVPHWQYPIWAWHWDDPAASELGRRELRALELDTVAQEAKDRALACHVSQHTPLSDTPGDEAILPPRLLAHFTRPVEVFVVSPERFGTPLAYFDDLYRRSADPWDLDTRFYEQRKRAAVLAALTRPRFRRAFEPGCATGALTQELARRCDQVVAWDAVADAVERTSRRIGDTPSVTVGRGRIPDDWPAGEFDLIVVSEVGYYCADLAALTRRIDRALAHDGVLVGCHWRHAATMHVHSADDVHAALGNALHTVVTHDEDDFLLQVWTRSGESVASAEGIVP